MQLKKCACTNIFNVIALKHFGNFKAALHACNYVDQCLIFLHTMLHVMDLNANIMKSHLLTLQPPNKLETQWEPLNSFANVRPSFPVMSWTLNQYYNQQST